MKVLGLHSSQLPAHC